MNRRDFISCSTALATLAIAPRLRASEQRAYEFPESELKYYSYIEREPVAGYHSAPATAYESFLDMKFGIRIHWGIYSIWHRGAESWPFLTMSLEDRQRYNSLYHSWNPAGFDADAWMNAFQESGMKMFAFTTKHHEGFSMFDTKTRVKNRADWTAPGGPKIESCDLAYSIMETPFRRDVVSELCAAAHKRGIKIDLYFSHPDWYDADFRPYVQHPLQVPSSAELMTPSDLQRTHQIYDDHMLIVPDPGDAAVKRMMERHRAQLVELLTNYGKIDMICLDMYLGPSVWPELRKTILKLRELQPDVMLRDRGIGNYGDYYTPERVVPGSSNMSEKPWFCIYPLGTDFSYEADPAKYKGAEWIVHNLVDTVAKGGGLMLGVGPSAQGQFHPEALRQMRAAGQWLQVNGEAIYATRPRDTANWSEGEFIRFTRSKDHRFVYAIMTVWPGSQIRLTSLKPRPNSKITLLGSYTDLQWRWDSSSGTTVSFPEGLLDPSRRPCSFAWTFKIETAEGS